MNGTHLPLASVKKIWSVKNSSASITRLTAPMVFDGCFELIVARHNGFAMVFDDIRLSFASGIYLAGQITRPMALQLEGGTELLFIKLNHGIAASLTAENLAQLTNQACELCLLNPALDTLLMPLLDPDVNSAEQNQLLTTLDNQIQASQKSASQFSKLACETLFAPYLYAESKSQLMQTFDLSKRGFETRFKRLVGVAPKQYSSLSRLRLVTEALIDEALPASLTNLALDTGFYDQAHFCRAMRNFVGASPQNLDASRWFIPTANDNVRFFTI